MPANRPPAFHIRQTKTSHTIDAPIVLVPLLYCCLSPEVQSGELWEPKGMTGPPVLKDPLEKVCLEADRAALWAASEAAVGEWDLDL